MKLLNIGSASGYNQVRTKVYGLSPNYLQIVNNAYYLPREVQDGLHLGELPGGEQDVVEALYSNESLDLFDGTKDPYNITVGNQWAVRGDAVEEIKVLVPEGFRDALSLDTSTQARMCARYQYDNSDNCNNVYRMKIRAMITKIPGFLFMSYRQIAFMGTVLISNLQYKVMLDDLLKSEP